MKENILEISDLENIFRDVFGDDSLKITIQSTPVDVSGWDSLKHLQVIFALEDHTGLRFSPEMIAEMNSVERIMEMVNG